MNQNNKILGAFSKLEDALKAAKILLKQNQRVILQRFVFGEKLLEDEFLIEEIEVVGD